MTFGDLDYRCGLGYTEPSIVCEAHAVQRRSINVADPVGETRLMTEGESNAYRIGLERGRAAECDRLRQALEDIDHKLRWFTQTQGAVSREDLVSMIRETKAIIESLRDLIYPQDQDPVEGEAAP